GLFAVCLIALGAAILVAPYLQGGSTLLPNASKATDTPRILDLSKGTFTIPGEAYMDGRGLDAQPPLTLMSINVWDDLTPPRIQVCSLPHGEHVQVLDAKWNTESDMYAFQVKSGSCKGWVNEWFLSTQYEEPIGDRMP
ncbi:MAG: hypothetical protein AABZ58_13340, partial [Chloroflexota bacterium]